MPNLSTVLQINSGNYSPDAQVSTPAAPAPATPDTTQPAPQDVQAATPDLTGKTVTYDLGDGNGPQTAGVTSYNSGVMATDDGRVFSPKQVISVDGTPQNSPTGPTGRPKLVINVSPKPSAETPPQTATASPTATSAPVLTDSSPAGKAAFAQALLNAPDGTSGTVHPSLSASTPSQSPSVPQNNSGWREPLIAASNVVQGAAEAIPGTVDFLFGPRAANPADPDALKTAKQNNLINVARGLEDPKTDAQLQAEIQGSAAASMPMTRAIDAGLTSAGIANRPELQPQGAGEQLLAAGFRGVGAAAGTGFPGGAAGAVSGFASGVGSEIGHTIAPDNEYAPLIGGLIGGAMLPTAAAIGRGVTRTFGTIANRATAPMNLPGRPQVLLGTLPNGEEVTATQQQMLLARQRLLSASSNPDKLVNSLDPDNGTIVPGSNPTMGQMSGDAGILALEKSQATKNPELFTQRRAEQTNARWEGLKGIRPAEADPFDAREYLGQTLDDIKTAHDAKLANIHAVADRAAQGMQEGDPFAARDYLETQLREMDARRGAAVAGAQAKVDQTAEKLDGKMRPNEYGQEILSELEEGRKIAKEIENLAWDAIDPDNKIMIDASPISDGANQIRSEMPRLAKKMTGEEKTIFDDAATLTGPDRFREVTALRNRITDALSEELRVNGRSQTYRRLSMLLGKVDDTMLGAVERQAIAEAAAKPADGLADRIVRGWRDDFYERRRQEDSGAINATDDSGLGAGRTGSVPSRSAGKSQAAGKSGGSPRSDSGIQGTVDQGLAERYSTARATSKERASTFDEGPVGQALAAGKNQNGYAKTDSRVAQTFFGPGAKSFDDAQAYMKAVGDRPKAVALGRDYLASDFLRSARGEDGIVDPAKADAWIAKHQDVLRHFPELKKQFANTAEASRTVGDVAAEHQERIDEFNDSAARHFIGADPDKAIERVMGSTDPAGSMRELMTLTKSSPEAQESIRSNFVRYFTKKGMATEGKETLQSILDDPKVMRVVNQTLDPEQVRTLKDVARSLEEAKAIVADHTAAVKAFEEGPAKYFNDTDPKASIERVMSSKDPAQALSDLMTLTKDSPTAQASLRAGVVDWIKAKIANTAEIGGSGVKEMSNRAIQDIVTDPKTMRGLRQILSPDQIKIVQDIAKDAARTNRSTVGVKLPGGSDTAQNLHGLQKHGGGSTILGQVMATEIGGAALQHIGGPMAKITGLVGGVIGNAMRMAGLQKVDDVVTYLVLHPEIGRVLLAQAPADVKAPIIQTLLKRLANVPIGTAVQANKTQSK